VSTTYNSSGDVDTYTDATGNTTTTGYDIDGRPDWKQDNKGTIKLTYDGGNGEHRGLVTSEDIGTSANSTFTATYDTDGNPTQTYPGGLTASGSYDNAGNQTGLTYTKAGDTLMAFTQTIGDQNTGTDHVVAQSSKVNGTAYSSQTFTDDPYGRLTTVQDTYNGSCTTRAYTYDTHSNRAYLISSPPAAGGACSTASDDQVTSYAYDGADRLTSDTSWLPTAVTNTYAYDVFGRTSTLPAGDATGIGSHNAANGGPSGAVTLGYYSNDMVASQAQGSAPNAASIVFGLDPNQDRISTESTITSAGTKTVTNHYDDDSDSPAWTSSHKVDGTTVVKRYLNGIDGNLDALVNDNGDVKLELTNLHGDTVATIDPDATSITGYHETTEFGAPRDPASADDTYGWLGAKKRSTDDLGGLTLMGVRLYNPENGRFASVDPIYGGNANAYNYPDDPTDQYDLSGEACTPDQNCVTSTVTNQPTKKHVKKDLKSHIPWMSPSSSTHDHGTNPPVNTPTGGKHKKKKKKESASTHIRHTCEAGALVGAAGAAVTGPADPPIAGATALVGCAGGVFTYYWN
jgi:RHS repeat-associated protein